VKLAGKRANHRRVKVQRIGKHIVFNRAKKILSAQNTREEDKARAGERANKLHVGQACRNVEQTGRAR